MAKYQTHAATKSGYIARGCSCMAGLCSRDLECHLGCLDAVSITMEKSHGN